MNSGYGKKSSPNSFDFDLGLGSSRPKSLNEQKNQSTSSYSSYSYSSSSTTTTQSKPNNPSWTHQPAPNLSTGPTSMVGDIFGKNWGSASSGSGVGIVDKNPNLFGDLLTSALGPGKASGNVPLKNASPNRSPYSMGNLADSLPKTANSARSTGNWGPSGSGFNNISANVNVSTNRSENLGGPSMKSISGGGGGGGGGIGIGMSTNKDPFGSLVDFGSKQATGNLKTASKVSKPNAGDDFFGDFQNAAKSSTTTTTFPSSGSTTTAFPSSGFNSNDNNSFMGSNMTSNPKLDDFEMPMKQLPVQTSGGDPLDMFFSSSSASGGGATASAASGGQQFSEVDDWGFDSEFGGSGGNDAGGSTTEIEGLPPPPAGVSASAAKNKGIDNQKQGQYADAIKWLSWAFILLEKTGDNASRLEVLSCRASCYKEVGEYKKAVADCSKVLEHDDSNVSVLVQRALLYESMERYKDGAEDLRTVLKIDPGNRIARSTIHRLTKMAD